MSKKEFSDTDLINELIANFGRNQQTLVTLVNKVEELSKTNLDPIVQVKLKELRREILIEDVKGQDAKIATISKVIDQVCSTKL